MQPNHAAGILRQQSSPVVQGATMAGIDVVISCPLTDEDSLEKEISEIIAQTQSDAIEMCARVRSCVENEEPDHVKIPLYKCLALSSSYDLEPDFCGTENPYWLARQLDPLGVKLALSKENEHIKPMKQLWEERLDERCRRMGKHAGCTLD